MSNRTIYLDYAAATPLDEQVLKAMQPFFTNKFYNPSATYTAAQNARRTLDDARAKIAHWFGARSSEIIFTAGGTEANNLAIHGIMRQFPDGNVVVSAVEHESVLAPAREYDCRQVGVHSDGRINLEELAQKIDKNTVLVSIAYANNEIGTVQPLREISKIIAAKRGDRAGAGKPLYFHTDACQAANYLDLHVARLGVDLLSINGGKIYGPKQSGALYVKAGTPLKPLIQGGGQERNLRSGTENVALSVGLAEALELAQKMRRDETARLAKIQQEFINFIAQKFPQAALNGSQKYRLPNNLHITLPGQDNERLLIQLDQTGIMAAAGSACSASSQTPSHVLSAIGLSDQEARASLRFTMGRDTTSSMIRHTIQVLSGLLA